MTRNAAQRSRLSSRASVASNARSAGEYRGRTTWRRSDRQLVAEHGDLDVLFVRRRTEPEKVEQASDEQEGDLTGHPDDPGRMRVTPARTPDPDLAPYTPFGVVVKGCYPPRLSASPVGGGRTEPRAHDSTSHNERAVTRPRHPSL